MSKILVIEIENEIIKIVEGSKSINGLLGSINKCLSLSIPTNSVYDGKIINMDLIKVTIEKALLENNIKTRKTVFIINANSVITRKIELPLLRRKSETMSMIKMELEQLLSTDVSQMIIFNRVELIACECANRARYRVYGLSLNVYSQYIKLSKMLKLNMIALDISPDFFEKIPEKNLKINGRIYLNGINAFINIDYNSMNFCVVNKGMNDFSRVIYLNLNEYEVYQADIVAEVPDDIFTGTKTGAQEYKANQWLDEISKYITYYYLIEKGNIIDKIYIYGLCSEIDNLEQYLSKNLNINVEIIREISNLGFNYSNEELNLIEYFHCVLALFVNKNDVNFLTDKFYNHKFKFNLGVAVMAASLFFVLAIVFYTHGYFISNEALTNEIKSMSLYVNNKENISFYKEVERLKNSIAFLEKYNEQAIKVKEVISEEDCVKSQIFREIAHAKPSDTKIMFIAVDMNNIQMQCTSSDMEDTMLFLRNLRKINFIDNIYVPAVDVKQEGEHRFSYSIICKLRDVNCNESM